MSTAQGGNLDLEPGRPLDPSRTVPQPHLRRLAREDAWLLWLPWATNPTPMNRSGRRGSWRAEYAAAAQVRRTSAAILHGAIPPLQRIRVRLDWEVTTRRTRDEDNLVKCMKHLVDGLVDAHVVPDDSRAYVERLMPEINYAPASPARRPHMRLWIWNLPTSP